MWFIGFRFYKFYIVDTNVSMERTWVHDCEDHLEVRLHLVDGDGLAFPVWALIARHGEFGAAGE